MAAGSTYTPIASTTLGSSQSSVTFSSLGSYTDLVIDVTGTSAAAANVIIRFNGENTGTNYSFIGLNNRSEGAGTAVVTARTGGTSYMNINWYTAFTGDARSQSKIHIMNYRGSTYKSVLIRSITAPGNSTFSGNEVITGLWRNTAAITSVQIVCDGSTFSSGSTFNVYGIASA